MDDGPPPRTIRDLVEREEAGEDPEALLEALLAEGGASAELVEGIREAGRQIGEELERIDAWTRSGDPRADWAFIWLWGSSEADRLAALRRILDRIKGPPIYPLRWAANRDRFLDALEDLGTTVANRAEAAAWPAIRELTAHLTAGRRPPTPRTTASSA